MNIETKTTELNAGEILLYFIISLIFVSEYIIGLTSNSTYVALNIIAVVLILFSKQSKLNLKENKFVSLWILALFVAIISFLRSSHSPKGLYSVWYIAEGIFLMCGINKINNFYNIKRIIIGFSVFHFLGVILEFFSPEFYMQIMEFVPLNVEAVDVTSLSQDSGLRGFSTNTGIPASFLTLGIICILSDSKFSKRNVILLLCFLIGLLLTAKRGSTLYLTLSVFVDFFIRIKFYRHNDKVKIYIISSICLIFLLLVLLFAHNTINIPLVSAINKTVVDYKNGSDVSTSRFALWIWALGLIKKNPIIGIGWGDFRLTTAGNATVYANAQTHNIYLQLLCETGIVGAIPFFIVLGYIFYQTYKSYLICLRFEKQYFDLKPKFRFAFIYQCYFLLLGLTGNPIYDYFCNIPYFICCSILMKYIILLDKREVDI